MDKKKDPITEEELDAAGKEIKYEKNLKERIYDQIKVPVWVLDIVIVGCIAALAYIILFKRA